MRALVFLLKLLLKILVAPVILALTLQVVIGLCRRKETAALKIKAAVSNGRVKLSALRRLFFFCRRPVVVLICTCLVSNLPLLLSYFQI